MLENSGRGIERAEHLPSSGAGGLERSCKVQSAVSGFTDGMHVASQVDGIERLEARIHGNGYAPHRHDTYALGLTLHGVQSFRYRGIERHSNPGNVIVLHPDELHDGAAGTDEGLIYRMVYLPPELIAAQDGHSMTLPFVVDPVVDDPSLWHTLADLLEDLDCAPTNLLLDDAMTRIADGLSRMAGTPRKPIAADARTAVLRARELLDSQYSDPVRSETLETATGLDRYELARQFRRILGTSPHRYLVMRRLGKAKQLLAAGNKLAETAIDVGFADQAHFTRHFGRAFGMTPGRWIAMQGARV